MRKQMTTKKNTYGPFESILYPVEKISIDKNDKRILRVSAYKHWVEDRIKKSEGIEFEIPSLLKSQFPFVFAVLSVEVAQDKFNYVTLHLLGHCSGKSAVWETGDVPLVDVDGDVNVDLTISLDLLKSWTGLSKRDIDIALSNSVHVGYTYNIIAHLPRQLILDADKVIIRVPLNEQINGLNVCVDLLRDTHPADRKA